MSWGILSQTGYGRNVENNKCVVCGKTITMSYDICADCATLYGPTYSDFPPWLLFLLREAQRERRRISRGYYDREVPLEDLEDYPYIDDKDKDRF